MIADPHEIQRLRYTPGQDLLSRDFRDQAAFDEQLRWWHNRAMHGAFGVRYGLTVKVVAGAAEPTVRIDGGLAYDAFGRELILPVPRRLRVPAGPEEVEPRVLVIRYREAAGPAASGGLAGVCRGEPGPLGADLAWRPARRLRPADGVPLARVAYDGGEPFADADFHPPLARPLARPRLGHGSTVAGATAWYSWSLDIPIGLDRPLQLPGLERRIDTRAAGFTRRPCYFAWLQGAIPAGKPGVYLQCFRWIERAEEDETGFRFRLLFSIPVLADGERDVALRRELVSRGRQQLSVCWLGIQPESDDHAPFEVTHGHP